MKLAVISTLGAALAALLPQSAAPPTTAEPQTVRVMLRDGTILKSSLMGVGCPIAICSRTAFKGVHREDSVVREEFERLVEIRDATTHAASFIAKDGSSTRLTLLHDFRVLYLADSAGKQRKVDIGEVKSVEFIGAAR